MSETYFEMIRREFGRLKKLGDDALAQTAEQPFFACPAAGDNSMAVLVKHVSGNLHSRWTDFLTSDGEKPGRDRDLEFRITESDTRTTLLAAWDRGWAALFQALGPLHDSDLERRVVIRGESLSVLQAVNRQLTHYAYHVGQMVYLAKHFAGPAWKSLSIPLGGSAQFNQRPGRYVERA